MCKFYRDEPTERQKKIYQLRDMVHLKEEAAIRLFRIIELECGMILDNPDKAPESMVRRYNQLVRGSNLPFSVRDQLLMAAKNK